MTGASAAVGGDTPTDTWQRTSTPASTIGPWLPEGDLGVRLAAGLGRVEEALRTAVGSEHEFVREAAGHLVAAGGKRFRPLLALLAAELGDPDAPEVTEAAVVCELTHLATLYHDDVMDEAVVRRGTPSWSPRSPPSVRRSASPSSSPTTCSTSSAGTARRGRHPARTCGRASPRCPRSSRSPTTTRPSSGCASWSPARSPTTASTPRPWSCCAPPRRSSGPPRCCASTPTGRRRGCPASPGGRSATRSRRCATTSSRAPAEQGPPCPLPLGEGPRPAH